LVRLMAYTGFILLILILFGLLFYFSRWIHFSLLLDFLLLCSH
jgi:hypothetical protein